MTRDSRRATVTGYPDPRNPLATKTTKKAAKKSPPKKAVAKRATNTQAAISAAAKSVANLEKPKRNGTPESEPEKRIEGTPDQRQDAAQRAEACSHALDEVLTRFRCRIVPVLNPTLKMVGGSPNEPSSEGIISCTYGVAPSV